MLVIGLLSRLLRFNYGDGANSGAPSGWDAGPSDGGEYRETGWDKGAGMSGESYVGGPRHSVSGPPPRFQLLRRLDQLHKLLHIDLPGPLDILSAIYLCTVGLPATIVGILNLIGVLGDHRSGWAVAAIVAMIISILAA